MRRYRDRACKEPKRLVLPEGDDEKILKATQILVDEGIARPILLGSKKVVEAKIERLGLDLLGRVEVQSPRDHPRLDAYCREYSELRQRKGVTLREAAHRLGSRRYFAMMMVRLGDADAAVLGMTTHYPDSLRPALEIVGMRPGVKRAAGMYMVLLKNEVRFFADCTVNVDPSAEDLAEIAVVTANEVRSLGLRPRVAMISFSNFGSSRHDSSRKMAEATRIVHSRRPDIEVDGEMQFNVAVDHELMKELYPFCRLKGPANTFIFSNLDAGNAAYKIVARLGGAEVVGPILMGLNKPVMVLQRADTVVAVVRLASIAVVEAQGRSVSNRQDDLRSSPSPRPFAEKSAHVS